MWQNVSGGEAAPKTPRATARADEPEVRGEEAARGVEDEAMDEDPQDEDNGPDVEMDFIGTLNVEDSLGSIEPALDDVVSSLLLQQLGSLGRSYRREARQGAKALVSEIYSPPRVTALIKQARMKHVLPGFALDITVLDPLDGEPWDFSLEHKRRRARQLVHEQKPFILIGSPECRQFSTWQALNTARSQDTAAIARAKAAAVVHLDFVAQLYHEQMEANRYFLHEHPLWATSWAIPSISELMSREDVQRVRGDQ